MSRQDWSKLTDGWVMAAFLGTLTTHGLVAGLSPQSVHAQIIPDTTLPVNSAVPNGCTICPITGGTLANDSQTLFHSFQQFST